MTPARLSKLKNMLWVRSRIHPAFRSSTLRVSYRFRITALGASVLVLILIMGYGAVTSGTNLVYYLFALLIAGFLTHGIVSPRNLDKLEVERRLPRKFVAGCDQPISFILKNQRRWWKAYNLLLEDRAKTKCGVQVVGRAVCSVLQPRETTTVYYTARSSPFRQRGIIEFREVAIRSLFPFGFIERAVFFSIPGELLILPPIYRIAAPLETLFADSGEISRPKRGQSGDLYGLREYVAGEPAKRIHWRTSARARRIMVTEFEREEHRNVVLALPTAISLSAAELTEEVRKHFEFAIILTVSVAAHLISNNFNVGLVTNHGEIAAAGGETQIERIQRALAVVDLTTDKGSRLVGTSAREQDVIYIQHPAVGDIPEGLRVVAQLDVREWQLVGDELRRRITV